MLTRETLTALHYALKYLHLHYCNVVWGMAQNSISQSLLLLQKQIVRSMSNVKYDEYTEYLFKNLKIFKISEIYDLECLKYFHEQIFKFVSINLQSALHIHNIPTRNSNLLRPPFPSTEAQSRFVNYYGCSLWNTLAEDNKKIQQWTLSK